MIHELNERLAFAPQIQSSDVANLAKQGYTQLICNRSDDEEVGQPSIVAIQAAAEQCGLNVVYAPVADSQFTEDVIDRTQQALAAANDMAQKTLMFCRSGTRSSVLWAIIQTRQGEPLAHTLAKLTAIGYDIKHLRDFIVDCANKS